MKVICLFGKANCGKTTTIKNVFNEIKKKGTVEYQNGEIDKPKKDFVAVVKIDNLRIGFFSGGDSLRVVEDGFKELEPFDCDVIVRAARSSGKTKDYRWESEDVILIGQPNLDINDGKEEDIFKKCTDVINYQAASYVQNKIMEELNSLKIYKEGL